MTLDPIAPPLPDLEPRYRPPERPARSRGAAGWVVFALIALAAAVRLPTLSQQSFWLDEGYTLRMLHMSFGAMLRTIPQTESTPYAYYMVAWGWVRVLGFDEYGVRSLSALAGIATVPVVYATGSRLGGRRAAAVAGLLVAVSPLMVWFSQEARAYALATLLSALTLLFCVRYVSERRSRWLVLWAASAAVGLATHYFLAFVVAGEIVWLWRAAPRDRRLAAAFASVVATGLALTPLAIEQEATGHVDYIAGANLATTVVQIPKQLLIGYASPGQAATAALATLLLLVGAVLPIACVARVRQRAAWPLAVGGAAVLVPIMLALGGVDFLNTRNLLPTVPPLAVAAGIGFAGWGELPIRLAGAGSGWPVSDAIARLSGAAVRRRAAIGASLAACLAVLSLAVIALVVADPRYQRDDWRGVARALGPARAARVVLVSGAPGLVALRTYIDGLAPLRGPVSVRSVDLVAMPANVLGGGIGAPPRSAPSLPGFQVVGASHAATFTVVRLRARTGAPAPVVDPAQAHVPWPASGHVEALLQQPRR